MPKDFPILSVNREIRSYKDASSQQIAYHIRVYARYDLQNLHASDVTR
jgi:hypothetical protein